MEVARNPVLSRVCRSIADVRETINESKQTEKGLMQSALREMMKSDTKTYKSNGVELIHVHGDDKVRVRLVNSDEDGEEAPKANPATDAWPQPPTNEERAARDAEYADSPE